MKNILIIGAGRFGYHICKELNTLDVEILMVDTDEVSLKEVDEFVSKTLIGDSSDIDFLKSLGINTFDECIVAIGDDFQSSLETVLNLKELGAKRILARASKGSQEKLLLKIGADKVIYPEKQLARWVALHTGTNSIYDFMELDNNFNLYEVKVPKEWIGKTLAELDLRKNYNINILGIRINGKLKIVLSPSFILKEDERILLIAKEDDAKKIFK